MRSTVLATCLAALSFSAHATCSYSSAPAATFGIYDTSSSTPLDWQANFVVSCNQIAIVQLSYSTGSSGAYAARTMKMGANALQYNLYSDSARTTIIGDGSANTSTATFFLFGGTNTRTIYGRIPALQDVAAGPYSDTVVMTVNY